jgi:hypothetical protein
MELALPHGVQRGWRHFLFGATDATLDRLVARRSGSPRGSRSSDVSRRPTGRSPPRRTSGSSSRSDSSGANVVWVGLGMPKQELWMAPDARPAARRDAARRRGGVRPAERHRPAGTRLDAGPRARVVAYRLWREPRRLWRRYLSTTRPSSSAWCRRRSAGCSTVGMADASSHAGSTDDQPHPADAHRPAVVVPRRRCRGGPPVRHDRRHGEAADADGFRTGRASRVVPEVRELLRQGWHHPGAHPEAALTPATSEPRSR